jgi:hypothetical protein
MGDDHVGLLNKLNTVDLVVLERNTFQETFHPHIPNLSLLNIKVKLTLTKPSSEAVENTVDDSFSTELIVSVWILSKNIIGCCCLKSQTRKHLSIPVVINEVAPREHILFGQASS